ncbi:glycoside-pentoside-hexuronide (GPH):cation symporter [Citromicrobium bathyomarinum]
MDRALHADEAQPSFRLSFFRRLGFGIGDFGINIFWNTTNLFAMFFYTDVIGLSNIASGTIIFGAMLWDALTDPVAGYFIGRTNSRLGKFRPYLLLGALPLGISFWLMFNIPEAGVGAMVAYAFGSQLLFRTCYTVVSVPYSSLSASMTRDADERSRLAVHRMVFATAAGVVVAGLTRAGADALGAGDLALGFERVAIIYGTLGLLVILLCGIVVREPVRPEVDPPLPSMRQTLAGLRGNSAFLYAFAIIVIGMSGMTIANKGVLYYLKYNLGAEDKTGLVLVSVALSLMVFVPLWGVLAQKFGKRRVWLAGTLISILSTSLLFINPMQQVAVVTPLFVLGAIGGAAHYFSIWAIIPDTVEFGEWKTGVRIDAVVFGAVAFAQKLSLGFATLIAGVLLDAFGYIANQPQTDTALFGIKALISLVPLTTALICLPLVIKFPLDRVLHAQIVRDIADRQPRNQGI